MRSTSKGSLTMRSPLSQNITRMVKSSAKRRERADAGNEARSVPLFTLNADKHEAGDQSGDEWDSEIDADTFGDLRDADVDDAALESEPRGQNGDEDPRVEAIENDLEDTVEGDKSGDVVRVAFGQFVPDQHHGDAAGDADQNQPAHVSRFAAQEDDGQKEHQYGADEPVLHQREAKDATVAKDFAKFFVTHFGQGRIHHDDESDGDGDIGGADLKAVDKGGRAGMKWPRRRRSAMARKIQRVRKRSRKESFLRGSGAQIWP